MKDLLKEIIDRAAQLGLPQVDVAAALEFLDHHEFGLCLDTIVTQLYEYDIKIDEQLYQLIIIAANKMHIPFESINFIKSLR